jgi:hypothetical protein
LFDVGRQASEVYHTFALLSANNYPGRPTIWPMNNDRAEVDELILEILDYKNDYADMLPKNF